MSQPPTPGDGRAFTFGPPAAAGRTGKPSTLGIVGLVLVGIHLLVVIAGFVSPHAFAYSVAPYPSASDSTWELNLSVLGVGDWLSLAFELVGLAGWIIGIVATVKNRGRAFGIAAIVVGVPISVITSLMTFAALLIKSVG
jgi:hypothetical protein